MIRSTKISLAGHDITSFRYIDCPAKPLLVMASLERTTLGRTTRLAFYR